MQNRYQKITPRQVKNRMIVNRNSCAIQQPISQTASFHNIVTFKQTQNKLMVPPKPNITHLDKQYQSSKKTGRQSLHNSQAHPAALKLKDYLHLHNLQRKSKEKRTRKEEHSPKNKSDRKSFQSHKHGKTPQKKTWHQKQQEQSHKMKHCEEMIKLQIQTQISEELQKLSQIKMFLQQDFKDHKKSDETFLALFNILNGVLDIKTINKKIGNTLLNFQETGDSTAQSSKLRLANYYWKSKDFNTKKSKQNLQQLLAAATSKMESKK